MKTKMIWVKVIDLVAKSNDFQITNKTKGKNMLWCLTRKGVPVMYQEKVPNTQPFCNVFCLVEADEKINSVSTIMAIASGVDCMDKKVPVAM